ncbi:hypothetical protein XHC_1176 [Xanthomonas hortorum pv. carotae str. M081]|nr:hypothetical protein XHC_1176 [Xanthomonas hortorum pv. carotae str. M081]
MRAADTASARNRHLTTTHSTGVPADTCRTASQSRRPKVGAIVKLVAVGQCCPGTLLDRA